MPADLARYHHSLSFMWPRPARRCLMTRMHEAPARRELSMACVAGERTERRRRPALDGEARRCLVRRGRSTTPPPPSGAALVSAWRRIPRSRRASAGLHDVGLARRSSWVQGVDDVRHRREPDAATARREPRQRGRGRGTAVGSGSVDRASGRRPSVRREPSVAAEDDSGGGGGSSVHRGGDDEVGGESLADAPGIEGSRRAELHDRPIQRRSSRPRTRHVATRGDARSVACLVRHGRVERRCGGDRRRGPWPAPASPLPDGPPAARRRQRLSSRTRRCRGGTGLQHASSRRCGSSPTRRGARTPPPRLRRARRATAHRPEAPHRSSRRHCDCSETTTGMGGGGGGAGVVATTGGGGATATGAGAAGIVVASGTIVDVGARTVAPAGPWWWRRPPRRRRRLRCGLGAWPARSDQPMTATRPQATTPDTPAVAILATCAGGAVRRPGAVLVATPSSRVARSAAPARCCRRRRRHSPPPPPWPLLSSSPPPLPWPLLSSSSASPPPPSPRPAVVLAVIATVVVGAQRHARRSHRRGWLRSAPRPTPIPA